MMILQTITTSTQVGVTFNEVLAGLSFIIINLGSIFAAWYSVKMKIKEQDLRINAIEAQFDKFQLDNDKINKVLEDSLDENKKILQDLHVKFEKHLSYHEALSNK